MEYILFKTIPNKIQQNTKIMYKTKSHLTTTDFLFVSSSVTRRMMYVYALKTKQTNPTTTTKK